MGAQIGLPFPPIKGEAVTPLEMAGFSVINLLSKKKRKT
jgi:hypothetical protein